MEVVVKKGLVNTGTISKESTHHSGAGTAGCPLAAMGPGHKLPKVYSEVDGADDTDYQ